MSRLAVAFTLGIALLMAANPAFAVDDKALAIAIETNNPEAALRAVAAAYHTGTLADKALVSVQTRAGKRQASVVVRWTPGTEGQTPSCLRLELGKLDATVSAGVLTVVNRDDTTRMFTADANALSHRDLLESAMPSIPLPQIDLVGGQERIISAINDWLGPTSWTSIETKGKTATLHGSVGDVVIGDPSVSLTIDRETCRIREFHGPVGLGRVDVTCSATDPGKPDAWKISTEGRQRVAAVSTLAKKSGPAKPLSGERLPSLSLMSNDLKAVPASALTTVPDGPGHRAAVLFFYRVKGDGSPITPGAEADVRRGCASAASAAREYAKNTPGSVIAIYAIGCLGLGEVDPSALASRQIAWVPPSTKETVESLWSAAGNVVLDRLGDRVRSGCLVIDGDQIVRGAVRIDNLTDDDSTLEQRIVDALRLPK